MVTNCRFGLMAWPLIILSFAFRQAEVHGLSDSMVVTLIIMLVYLVKFFIWEPGYLRSIDIMHDRAGFMICWGCLVWVPAIYTSPVLYLVDHPNHLGLIPSIVIAALGVTAVLINYLADRQRQAIRETSGKCRIWGREPRTIHARYRTEDGVERQTVLQASGWWGLARHFHYCAEILAAFLWTVPALFFDVTPYFYVIFLTILLAHRSLRDEQRCQQKYGAFWDEYCSLVPSRVIPGLKF